MSHVGIRPTGEVTEEMRGVFRKLVLLTEPRGTLMWMVRGDHQTAIKGAGSLHKEGRYILTRVAKQWKQGALYCTMLHPGGPAMQVLHYCVMPWGTVISTSRQSLQIVFPGANIMLGKGVA